jgi:hypothetical protein
MRDPQLRPDPALLKPLNVSRAALTSHLGRKARLDTDQIVSEFSLMLENVGAGVAVVASDAFGV